MFRLFSALSFKPKTKSCNADHYEHRSPDSMLAFPLGFRRLPRHHGVLFTVARLPDEDVPRVCDELFLLLRMKGKAVSISMAETRELPERHAFAAGWC